MIGSISNFAYSILTVKCKQHSICMSFMEEKDIPILYVLEILRKTIDLGSMLRKNVELVRAGFLGFINTKYCIYLWFTFMFGA